VVQVDVLDESLASRSFVLLLLVHLSRDLSRYGSQTAHQSVSVRTSVRTFVVAFDNHRLLARISAIGDYNNFTACACEKRRRENTPG
jgi:hypothetical protein